LIVVPLPQAQPDDLAGETVVQRTGFQSHAWFLRGANDRADCGAILLQRPGTASCVLDRPNVTFAPNPTVVTICSEDSCAKSNGTYQRRAPPDRTDGLNKGSTPVCCLFRRLGKFQLTLGPPDTGR